MGVPGEELRALRVVYRITQAELAAEMGTGQSYVSIIELRSINAYRTADRYREALERFVARERLVASS